MNNFRQYLRRIRDLIGLSVPLSLASCVIDEFSNPEETLESETQRVLTLQASEPLPTVTLELALSEFAIRRFHTLDLELSAQSEQGLQGTTLRLEHSFMPAPRGLPSTLAFDGPLANQLQLNVDFSDAPCATGPCNPRLQLSPVGEHSKDIAFSIQYLARAVLTTARQERFPVAGDLQIVLEVEDEAIER